MMIGSPILLGRTIPGTGAVIDFGAQIDYLIVKNKDPLVGIWIGFLGIPTPPVDAFAVPKDGGFDMGGLNIRYVGILPQVNASVEVDFAGVQTRLASLDSTRGGPVRANNPYPFMIQLSEPLKAHRKNDSIVIPQRGVYCDWITNSMGGDAGNDSPIYY
jgi:hypothetical protein